MFTHVIKSPFHYSWKISLVRVATATENGGRGKKKSKIAFCRELWLINSQIPLSDSNEAISKLQIAAKLCKFVFFDGNFSSRVFPKFSTFIHSKFDLKIVLNLAVNQKLNDELKLEKNCLIVVRQGWRRSRIRIFPIQSLARSSEEWKFNNEINSWVIF